MDKSFQYRKKGVKKESDLGWGIKAKGLDYLNINKGKDIQATGLNKSEMALMNMLEDAEQARLEERKERKKTSAIVYNLVDGLLSFNKEGVLSLINPRALKLLGFSLEGAIGKTIKELSETATSKLFFNFYKKNRRKKILRKEIEAAKGIFWEVSIIPITEENKTQKKALLEILIIIHDISKEKLIERSKTEFVSLAAHQLRTPLSAVKWVTKMILDGDLGAINKEQKEFLEDAYTSNERMIVLVNDLLNVARIEEGRYIFKPRLANVEDIANKVAVNHKKDIGDKRLKVTVEKPDKRLPLTMMDVEKITIVIDNLLKNSIKYTPAGGKVTISFKHDKKEIEVCVRDTGVGIPENQQKRIFTKFFRANNILKLDTTGSGLGLFIIKNIVEAHKGKIWFKSKEGKGTSFHFTLPIKKTLKVS